MWVLEDWSSVISVWSVWCMRECKGGGGTSSSIPLSVFSKISNRSSFGWRINLSDTELDKWEIGGNVLLTKGDRFTNGGAVAETNGLAGKFEIVTIFEWDGWDSILGWTGKDIWPRLIKYGVAIFSIGDFNCLKAVSTGSVVGVFTFRFSTAEGVSCETFLMGKRVAEYTGDWLVL